MSNLAKQFTPLIKRLEDKQEQHLQLENIASRIHSIDELMALSSQYGHQDGFKQQIDGEIRDILKDAERRNINIVGTLQRFIRRKDENVIFDYMDHIDELRRKNV